MSAEAGGARRSIATRALASITAALTSFFVQYPDVYYSPRAWCRDLVCRGEQIGASFFRIAFCTELTRPQSQVAVFMLIRNRFKKIYNPRSYLVPTK